MKRMERKGEESRGKGTMGEEKMEDERNGGIEGGEEEKRRWRRK